MSHPASSRVLTRALILLTLCAINLFKQALERGESFHLLITHWGHGLSSGPSGGSRSNAVKIF
jgi:hypothetical protein